MAATKRNPSPKRHDHGARVRAILAGAVSSRSLEVAARALAFVEPASITPREERLVSLAEEFREHAGMHIAFASHMQIYLALALCEWVSRDALSARGRDAALTAATALAVGPSANLRDVMGLSDRLRDLAKSCSNAMLAGAVRLALESGGFVPEVPRALGLVLRGLEARSGETLVQSA